MSELTTCLERGAKIPHQYPRMCSPITCKFPQSYCLISAHWLPHLFPAGPLPLMASFLEPSFRTVSNAAESLERCASVFPRQDPPCQLHGHPGRWGQRHLLVGFLPSHLPCPLHASCGNPPWRVAQSPWSSNTSACEFCTTKIEIILPACQITILIRNFLWKHRLYKLPLDLQTWTKKNSSLAKYDLGMKLILIMRDKKCCLGESKNDLSFGGGEIRIKMKY